MKSNFLFTLLSLSVLAPTISALPHQELSEGMQVQKDTINAMLEDINKCCTKGTFDLDVIAEKLYTKYRGDHNFQELIYLFNYMKKNCVISQNYQFETFPFEYSLENIKQYLNGTESIKRSQIAWVLFIRYNTNTSFGNMRRIFEKIANDQEKAQQRYLEAIETIRKLKNFTTLGIGRYK